MKFYKNYMNSPKSFLQLVADDLLGRSDIDFRRLVIVFPNKRASLFFNEHLRRADRPLWAPQYVTISELFRSLAQCEVMDEIEAVCRIYNIYIGCTPGAEALSLDKFYGWGRQLLADFDDVDKNEADAARLFANMSDYADIEKTFGAPEEAMRHFRSCFRDMERSEVRRKFLGLWNILYKIYSSLNAGTSEGIAPYEGALYRSVAERLKQGTLRPREGFTYVFAGFNVLSSVERSLMEAFKEQAIFYWDYDEYYTERHPACEAGLFVKENIAAFGNALPPEAFRNMERSAGGRLLPEIEVVEAPTETAQAKSVAAWLKKNRAQSGTTDLRRMAVVLAGETLMQGVLHALPEEVDKVNVTKGYPLSQTPAFALIDRFEPSAANSNEALLTALADRLKAEAARLAADGTIKKIFKDIYEEACFQAYTVVGRFSRLVAEASLNVTPQTLLRLLRTVLMQTDLPLHGEPLEGLQIMGVLETRLLDFDSVLVLSASEGNLPRKGGDNSFIPNELREAFSLTTVRRRTAVFAYYFYRLIQRARSVRLMYSAVTDGITRGEMSRFISQLLVESRIPISQYKMQLKPGISGRAGAADIAKPENLASLVTRLSPSSIINYMKCPQMFYFKHVAKIPEPQPPVQEVAPNVFGSVFHNAAELFYKDQGGRRLTPDMLKRAAKDTAKLREYVERAYISVRREAEPEADEQVCRSENAVMKSAAVKCLAKMLLYDATYQSVKVVAEEEKWELTVDVALSDGTKIPVSIKGFIDRVDEVEDVSDGQCRTLLRIVDYKTGGIAKALPDVPAMFCCDGKHEHYAFQVSLYALAYQRMHDEPAAPAIYYLNSLNKGNTPYLQMGSGKNAAPVYSYADYADEFEPALKSLLSSIFDPSKPFTVTEEPEKVCKYCPYGRLCGM